MKIKFAASFFVFFLSLACAFGQKKEGDKYFSKEDYSKALKFYNLYDKIDKRENVLLKRAICYYHVNKPSKGLSDLLKAERLGLKSLEFYKYTALSLHAVERFEEAALYYKEFLLKSKNKEEKEWAKTALRQCGFSRSYKYKSSEGIVENLGDVVNTKNNEERIIESVNYPNRIYFTSNRKESFGFEVEEDPTILVENKIYTKDIFNASYTSEGWGNVESFNLFLNTSKNEKLLDFSDEGKVVFFSSGHEHEEDWLLVDTAKEVRNSIRPYKFYSPINISQGDRDVQVVNDSIFFFASKRLEGFGGYDLFFTVLMENDIWSTPVNLGPQINTKHDEKTPYVHFGGKHLFFSSERFDGFGGLDVYVAEFNNGSWSTPSNVGLGINSTRDDLDFRLSRKGDMAYLTSNRMEGYGGLDLYSVRLGSTSYMGKPGQAIAFLDSYEIVGDDQLVLTGEDEEGDEGEEVGFWDLKDMVKETEDLKEDSLEAEVAVEEEVVFFKINPLFYDEDEFLKSGANMEMINRLEEMHRLDRDLKVLLISHSIEEDGLVFDLFMSAKRGERMIKEIRKTGISASNIHLMGVGSNYPMVKTKTKGQNLTVSEKMNRRFDLVVFPSSAANFEIEYVNPEIQKNLIDDKFESFNDLTRGLSFRVKAMESTKYIDDPRLDDFQDLIIEKEGKSFVYTIGILKSFEEAKELLDILKSNRFEDVEIRAYLNNILLEDKEAEEKVGIFPDLQKYLDFNRL